MKNYLFIFILSFIVLNCDNVKNETDSEDPAQSKIGYTLTEKDKGKIEVVLNSEPTDLVYLLIMESNSEDLNIFPSQLLYSPENWNVPQQVYLSKNETNVVDLNAKSTLEVVVATNTLDQNYSKLAKKNIDIIPTIVREESEIIQSYSYGIEILDQYEDNIITSLALQDEDNTEDYEPAGGGVNYFRIRLTAPPTSNVYVTCRPELKLLFSNSDPKFSAIELEEDTFCFSYNNWNVPKTVKIIELASHDTYSEDKNDETYVIIGFEKKSDLYYSDLENERLDIKIIYE